jgi:hypothetical protein
MNPEVKKSAVAGGIEPAVGYAFLTGFTRQNQKKTVTLIIDIVQYSSGSFPLYFNQNG